MTWIQGGLENFMIFYEEPLKLNIAKGTTDQGVDYFNQ